MTFSRRTLLAASFAATAAAVARAATAARVPTSPEVPPDFTGLSFETAELLSGSLLTPANTSLIALVRRLGRRGVIRLGGNSSDRDRDRVHPSAAAIAALAGFLRATGWSLIYGLDLGHGTPSEAAEEAATVAEAAGPALIAFQIGNEPDLFARSGLRPPHWGFRQYLATWERLAAAVRAKVPAARFAGPDIAVRGSWMLPFATRARPRPALLTRHFYAEGPASSPSVTIPRLLETDPGLNGTLDPTEAAARATGLPLRMSETNSVYDHGRPGVSDTLAAATWGANLMFSLAARGWAGVNFHDGPGRPYTPIGRSSPLARPLYYGMLFFAAALPRRVALFPSLWPLAAYRIEGTDARTRLALLNLDPSVLTARTLPAGVAAVSLLRLAAPQPSSSSVTLGGATVSDDGAWRPRLEHPAPGSPILLPSAAAVLVELS